MAKYPAAPNTESFVGMSNRAIIEREELNAEEGTPEENQEHDEVEPNATI